MKENDGIFKSNSPELTHLENVTNRKVKYVSRKNLLNFLYLLPKKINCFQSKMWCLEI